MNCREAIDVMGNAIDGSLQPGPRADFERHITACAPCATYLEHLHLTRKMLRTLSSRGATSPRRKKLIDEFRKEFNPGKD